MGQINQIKAQVFRAAAYESWREGCNPIPYQGIDADYKSEGERWMVPIIVNGTVDGYEETFEDASGYADAFKAIRLHHPITGDVIYILGAEQDWLDAANGCCGETPTMPQITIPDPNLSEPACCDTVLSESPCTYRYDDTTGIILAGQKIQVKGFNNGVAFTPASPGGGFATRDAAITWLNSNWSAYGTFVPLGTNGIELQSTTVSKGSFSISLLPLAYCLTVVPGDVFNIVTNNGVATTLPAAITVVDAAQVIAAIKDYFGDATLSVFSSTKISYLGTGVPSGYSGTNSRSFVSGVCS